MSNCGGDNSNLGSSSSPPPVPQQDVGGKNKRKLVDPSPGNPISLPSFPTEFPRCGSYLDKSQNPQSDLGHSVVGSSQPNIAAEADEPTDWSDPLAFHLEELLLFNIRTIFQNAIKQLCLSGFSEHVAQRAITRLGLYQGGRDIVANIVTDALALLTSGKDIDSTKDIVFENLQQMVEYTMLELVNVVRQVKPSLSTGEAMWRLLICDMNISQACAAEGDLLGECGCKAIPGASSSNSSLPKSRSKAQCSEPIPSTSSRTSQTSPSEGKSKKARKSRSKKELAARNKTLNPDKVPGNKGKSGKAASSGRLIMENRMKSSSESHGLQTKGSASNTKDKVEAPVREGSSHVPNKSPSAVSASDDPSKVHKEGTTSAANTELTVSGKKPLLKPEANTAVFPKISDYYSRIPYDESLGKYIPQDEKDELILKLVPQVQELQNELQSWTDWANQKVRQATHRLSKDKPELKALRLEKEEKKTLEENTLRRISEMELALVNAAGQVEAANSTICKLEEEQSLLHDEFDTVKLQAVEADVNCEEALEREKKALKDAQSWKGQKSLLQEELQTHKQRVTELQRKIGEAEKIKNHFEARWEQERMLNEKLLAEAASIRNEREQLEAAAKAGEDIIRQKAEEDLKKYMENISKLEKEISKLRLTSDASKIAALRRSVDGNYGGTSIQSMKGSQDSNVLRKADFQETCGSGGLKRDRECVMCLSEEKCVVFLPCAHQVLCTKCNEIHGKQGMKDCPSCRTPIQRRIAARFARP
ncbi:hypothetical protein MANES_01G211400v8 [Manihot esculenta]|uniref:Uncharacterized protein n=1 Tax=Manihot esculenta TaxID=3983 RepID=A0ACB7IED1_MANES|nr:hypothetical protein MANES_01G211400v8 [Manihot esculenta]